MNNAPHSPDETVISVRGLVRTFRVRRSRPGMFGALAGLFSGAGEMVRAVDDLSFEVGRGEFVGFIGPNGAGKSTTIKALTGILVPTAGQATVCGIVPWQRRQAVAARIGVVFGQRTQLWWDLPPADAFGLLAKIYRVPDDEVAGRMKFLGDALGLGPLMHTQVRKLSLGQRMRCELAAAMLHGPEVLFLDEPTIGLDLVAKDAVREILGRFNRELGTTILLTTHDLGDIEQLCRRVMVIDQGRLIHDGPLEALMRQAGSIRRMVAESAGELAPGLTLSLPPGGRLLSVEGRRLTIEFDGAVLPAPRLIEAVFAQVPLAELSILEPDIGTVIRRIYANGR